MRQLLGLMLLVTMLAPGCGSPAPVPPPQVDVAADAMRAFERGDWVLAARLLREAIAKQPTSLRLHYSLGVAAAHLDLRGEAIQEFQWVLANAPATSTEAQEARKWLLAAGVLQEPRTETAASVDKEDGTSLLRGRVAWADGQPPVSPSRLQIFLKGIRGTPTEDIQYVRRTDEEGRFEFKNIAAGPYRVTNRLAGQPTWRVRVEVPEGGDVTLDLTAQNSTRVKDDFPEEGK
jgi:hypothetical protein